MVLDLGQELLGHGEVVAVDGHADPLEHRGAAVALLLVLLALLVTIAALLLGIPASSAAAAMALTLDGVVGLVDLLHLLLGQIRQGVVVVVIRMVLPGQLTISLLDLLIRGGTGDIEYFIGIGHSCSSSLPPGAIRQSAA